MVKIDMSSLMVSSVPIMEGKSKLFDVKCQVNLEMLYPKVPNGDCVKTLFTSNVEF